MKNFNKQRVKKILFYIVILIILLVFFPSTDESLSKTEDDYRVESSDVVASAKGFRNKELLQDHYEKHGSVMGFLTAEEYEQAAIRVTVHPDTLHKIEEEDGDDVYYLESTNEFVVVSTDGYIRTYFNPSDGIEYFERQ